MRFPLRERRRELRLISEINVINLTDVALVLLIIFLISATALVTHRALELRLPKAETGHLLTAKTLTISVDSAGIIRIGDEIIAPDQLPSELLRRAKEEKPQVVVIEADKEADYGVVVKVLDAARQAGLTNVALTVEQARPGEELSPFGTEQEASLTSPSSTPSEGTPP